MGALSVAKDLSAFLLEGVLEPRCSISLTTLVKVVVDAFFEELVVLRSF